MVSRTLSVVLCLSLYSPEVTAIMSFYFIKESHLSHYEREGEQSREGGRVTIKIINELVITKWYWLLSTSAWTPKQL